MWERFNRDFKAALLRILAAAKGLRELYGYTSEVLLGENFEAIDFDSAVAWLQDANLWLTTSLISQEVYTRSFSLAQLLGQDRFKMVGMGQNGNSLSSPGNFFGRSLIRMRSISAQIVSSKSGRWNLALDVFEEARIFSPAGESRILGQNHVGRVKAGWQCAALARLFPRPGSRGFRECRINPHLSKIPTLCCRSSLSSRRLGKSGIRGPGEKFLLPRFPKWRPGCSICHGEPN